MAHQPPEDKIIAALAETKPRWTQDGLGIQGRAREAMSQTVRQEWAAATVDYKDAERPALTKPIELQKPAGQLSAVVAHPFQVYEAADETSGALILKMQPGIIADIQVPEAIDSSPATGEWSIFLRCWITTVEGNQFRSEITAVDTTNSNSGNTAAETANGTGISNVTWDDAEHMTGRFYIRVADVVIGVDGDNNPKVDLIKQWLFGNYKTFVIAGDQAVVL